MPGSDAADVVVAGHICLDIIPKIQAKAQGMNAILLPGKLVDIGPALMSTGGAVSNTGLALHRLGVRASLMGKVGDDLFGNAILELVGQYDRRLAQGMIVTSGESSSYTIVISPPDIDRVFLHCTGANDTFAADDLQLELIRKAKLFHFGYPPLMRRMYEDEGRELAKLLALAKGEGATVSLDLAKPDPESDAGRADWPAILRGALPHVDLFLPSFEEILYMLRKDLYVQLESEHGAGGLLEHANGSLLSSLAEELIGMGAAVVGLKLGEHGLYLRTTKERGRLARMGRSAPHLNDTWLGRELLAMCYQVEVGGTTGAGDCTIAGFLTGILHGGSPEEVLSGAVAVGACNVEKPDAVSGVPTWNEVRRRIDSGWQRRENKLELDNWVKSGIGLWVGPGDVKRNGGEDKHA